MTVTAGGAPVMLAIEASQRLGGVAVRDRAGEAHAEALRGELHHDDDLLPAIDRLYARLGLSPRDTGAIGVSIGPGGFTGLRIAVSTAKMLAEALGAKIVAVPTALVAAESHAGPGPIIVALASKGSTFWATLLDRDAQGHWRLSGGGALADAAALPVAQVKAVIGDAHLPVGVRDSCAAASVPVLEPVFDPAACLSAAWRGFEAGRFTDPPALLPIYARPPAAVAPRKR